MGSQLPLIEKKKQTIEMPPQLVLKLALLKKHCQSIRWPQKHENIYHPIRGSKSIKILVNPVVKKTQPKLTTKLRMKSIIQKTIKLSKIYKIWLICFKNVVAKNEKLSIIILKKKPPLR